MMSNTITTRHLQSSRDLVAAYADDGRRHHHRRQIRETKAQAFERIAHKRVVTALRAIAAIERMVLSPRYEPMPGIVSEIAAQLSMGGGGIWQAMQKRRYR